MKHQNESLIYLSNYGLSQNPFAVTPDPRFFMRSTTHLDALASMIYGIKQRKGFISLVGQVGTGKTTLLNTLMGSLDLEVIFSHIIYTDLSFYELLQMICTDFGMKVGHQTKVELMNELFDFLVENRLKGQNALVVIDEAQNLSSDVLESLRMLSNFETSREKLIQILLCGQPELKNILARSELRQLAQRFVVNAELRTLTARESEKYIYHRMAVAGVDGSKIFPQDITNKIAEISGGVPRIINIICDNCLMIAYAAGKSVVTEEMLNQVETDYFSIYDPELTDSVAETLPTRSSRHEAQIEYFDDDENDKNSERPANIFELTRIKDSKKNNRAPLGKIAMFCLIILLSVFAFSMIENPKYASNFFEQNDFAQRDDSNEIVVLERSEQDAAFSNAPDTN